MISFPVLFLTLFCTLLTEPCIITDNQVPDTESDGIAEDTEVAVCRPLNFALHGFHAALMHSLKTWAPWWNSKKQVVLKPLNSQHAVEIGALNMKTAIGELDISDSDRFFLIVFQYHHLKSVGNLVSFDLAVVEKANYIDNAAENIEVPIWARCKNYTEVTKYPVAPLEKWLKSEYISLYKVWASSDLLHYIVMLQHKTNDESHSHYRFLTITAKSGFPTVNFAGGLMPSPLLAEFSVMNFMMLGEEYTRGTWIDESKVTWKPQPVLLKDLNLGAGTSAIDKEIQKRIDANILEDLATSLKREYHIGLIPMNLPCPSKSRIEAMFCEYALDFYWLLVGLTDKKDSVHMISLSLQYRNNTFSHVEQCEYRGYVDKESYSKMFMTPEEARSVAPSKPPLVSHKSFNRIFTTLRKASFRKISKISDDS